MIRNGTLVPCLGPNINYEYRVLKSLKPYDQVRHHRSVYSGLHLAGKCSNKNCKVYSKMVWIPFGYGMMHYAEILNESPCPICKVELQPESIMNIGYRYAKVKFEGKQSTGEKVYFYDEERQGKLKMFDSGNGRELIGWMYLKFIVQQIYVGQFPPATDIQRPIEHLPLLYQWGVREGVNFQGVCTNRKCSDSFKQVRIPLGYGAFFFGEKIHECPCPICSIPINPESIKTIVFCNTKLNLEGRTLKEEYVWIKDEIRNGDMGIYTVQGPFLKIQAKEP